MGERIRELARKGMRFMASNIAGTAAELAVLFALSEYVYVSYAGDYLLAPFISFECAVLVNFLCSFFFVWKDRIRGGGFRYLVRKYIIYNLSSTGTFVIKMGILLLFEAIFGWDVLFCNIAALCFSGILNFVLGEWVVFRKRKSDAVT